MGAQQSLVSTLKNDFELVIRASKELEHLLKTAFGAPAVDASGRPNGLRDLIRTARIPGTTEALPVELQRKLRMLGTVRNRLVHDYGYDAIAGRKSFIKAFVSAEAELHDLLRGSHERATGGGDGGGRFCIVS
jgi:hypothetical protein